LVRGPEPPPASDNPDASIGQQFMDMLLPGLFEIDPTPFDIGRARNTLALLAAVTAAPPGASTALGELLGRLRPLQTAVLLGAIGAAAAEFGWIGPVDDAAPQVFADGPVTRAVAERATRAYRWLCLRIGPDGLELTDDGRLPPAVVLEAIRMMELKTWGDKPRDEAEVWPVEQLRTSAVELGLARKAKGALRVTRAGARALKDPFALWSHLATTVATRRLGSPHHDANILEALAIAHLNRREAGEYWDTIRLGLDLLGWRRDGFLPLTSEDALELADCAKAMFTQTDSASDEHEWFWLMLTGTPSGRLLARAVLDTPLPAGDRPAPRPPG
jgi:hypothetical protein